MGNHIHQFTELAVNPILRVHEGYNGTAGDKAFLTLKCSCGKVKAHDYGPTTEMQIKLKELTQ